MAYNDFKSVRQVVEEFGLSADSVVDLFPDVPPIAARSVLNWMINEHGPHALATGTEQARREVIIAPFLYEARALATLPTAIFSDVALDVNDRLRGRPDFLIGRGRPLPWVDLPLLAVFEAKEEKFGEGAGQCVAAMVGAREYNAARGTERPIYGCVTNGLEWVFYRLTGLQLVQQTDPVLYRPFDRLLGILVAIADEAC